MQSKALTESIRPTVAGLKGAAACGVGAKAGRDGVRLECRGLHSSTFQLNLSRVCHKQTPYTPPKHTLTPPQHGLGNPYAHPLIP